MAPVYVLTNPAMPGLVKIGCTEADDAGTRTAQLYTTGVPVPFEIADVARVDDMLAWAEVVPGAARRRVPGPGQPVPYGLFYRVLRRRVGGEPHRAPTAARLNCCTGRPSPPLPGGFE